jgi:hypothetical protein
MSIDRSFRIYLFAVCFVSVVCVTITSGMALYSLLKMAAPQITLDSHSYNAHQSVADFKRSHFYPNRAYPQALFIPGAMGVARALPVDRTALVSNAEPDPDAQPLSDEEIDELRKESYHAVVRNHKRTALQELIRLAIVLIVSSAVFFLHWRLTRRNGEAGG